MYIFNDGRKSLNVELFTSFCPKPDFFSFLLLSDDQGFLSTQTPRTPPSCVCRETRFKGRTKENLFRWLLSELKVGHRRAKFAREAITAVANTLRVSHKTIRRLWQRALPIIPCMLFSRYPTLCFASRQWLLDFVFLPSWFTIQSTPAAFGDRMIDFSIYIVHSYMLVSPFHYSGNVCFRY
jgi:hypothetical protein